MRAASNINGNALPSYSNNRPVILLTGASRGIGATTARKLASQGYALVLAARSAGPLMELSAELMKMGCPALPIPTDLGKPDEVQRLVRIALEHFGRVDVLVNNAGIIFHTTVEQAADAEVQAMITTNLIAPVQLTRALLPHMLARGCGQIIFLSSIAGMVGLPGSSLYSTTKFGLRGFAETLRREIAHRGINVSIIAPGYISTSMTDHLRWLPMPGPDLVARAIADVIAHPHREVVVPGYYRPLLWLERMFPGTADLVLSVFVRDLPQFQIRAASKSNNSTRIATD